MKSERQKELEAFLETDPMDPFLHYALGLEFLSQGHRSAAIVRFKKLQVEQPGYLPVYYQLGKCLEAENCMEEAVSMYRQGMEIALSQNNKHTYGELKSALEELEE